MPSIAELMIAELDREAISTRKVLANVPEGKNDWKPHEKSMTLGYLAGLVATMPSWIASMIKRDYLDLGEGGPFTPPSSPKQLVEAFDAALAEAKDALASTTEE